MTFIISDWLIACVACIYCCLRLSSSLWTRLSLAWLWSIDWYCNGYCCLLRSWWAVVVAVVVAIVCCRCTSASDTGEHIDIICVLYDK